MNFLAHRNDLFLTDCWVKGVLHFFLKLNFSFPKENFALSFDDVSENISFLFFKLRDLVFKLDRLEFEVFQFLLELLVDVEILVLQTLIGGGVFVIEIVKLVHLKIKVFKRHF